MALFQFVPAREGRLDVNVDNILGKIYFYMLNLKWKESQLLLEIMASILSIYSGKRTFSTLQSNIFKINKSQEENIIASYLNRWQLFCTVLFWGKHSSQGRLTWLSWRFRQLFFSCHHRLSSAAVVLLMFAPFYFVTFHCFLHFCFQFF